MKDIYIRSLSTPSVLKKGTPVIFQRNKSLVLFIYLHITGKNYSREELIDFFWPDLEPERAKANLRTVLSECRNLLGTDIFVEQNRIIGLAPGYTGSDYEDFLELSDSTETEDLKQAEILYSGSFLKGTVIHKSGRFDDWQFELQQQLEVKYQDLLNILINAADKENRQDSEIYYLQKAIGTNPYNEEYYYRLILIYSENGEYNSARHQYETLKKILKEENLGKPEKKIQDLISTINENQKLEKHTHSNTTKKTRVLKRILIISIFAAAVAVFAVFISVNHNRSKILRTKSVSVAVLPFNFLCDDENAHIFAECFTIEMINSLAEEKYLEVKPAQTVSGYKESILTVKEIAEELKVDYIIDGSAMSYDECIRFSVQLIEVRNDCCIWAGSYNCKIDNSLETELEIVKQLLSG